MEELKHYIYEGPITKFGRYIAYDWFGETYAVSPKKAKSNLLYQFKMQHDMLSSAKIEMAGELIKEA